MLYERVLHVPKCHVNNYPHIDNYGLDKYIIYLFL